MTRVKGLELVKPCETRKWKTHFPSESFQREKRTTFSDVPFIPEMFQWNVLKKCVPFTSQPEFPESLGKWKTPQILRVANLVPRSLGGEAEGEKGEIWSSKKIQLF